MIMVSPHLKQISHLTANNKDSILEAILKSTIFISYVFIRVLALMQVLCSMLGCSIVTVVSQTIVTLII